jgi:hypothetical protein
MNAEPEPQWWPYAPLHPMLPDRIENERCPDCGTPGRYLRTHAGGWLEEWGCPNCEPHLFEAT